MAKKKIPFEGDSVFDLLNKLDHLFYLSTDTHDSRIEQSNKILAELKTRFAETGI